MEPIIRYPTISLWAVQIIQPDCCYGYLFCLPKLQMIDVVGKHLTLGSGTNIIG
jgi:hypothetical protein